MHFISHVVHEHSNQTVSIPVTVTQFKLYDGHGSPIIICINDVDDLVSTDLVPMGVERAERGKILNELWTHGKRQSRDSYYYNMHYYTVQGTDVAIISSYVTHVHCAPHGPHACSSSSPWVLSQPCCLQPSEVSHTRLLLDLWPVPSADVRAACCVVWPWPGEGWRS